MPETRTELPQGTLDLLILKIGAVDPEVSLTFRLLSEQVDASVTQERLIAWLWFGKTSWGRFTYANIRPEDSFAYTDVFCDEEGNPLPDMPSSDSVVTLVERDGRTAVTTTTTFASEEALSQVLEMGMQEGTAQTLDRLEEILREAKSAQE
jgi:uncharacterized protein YndB with AHSA1/START domain